MKIAILMSGYLRTVKNNIDSIKKNIIQHHKVDFYIHITNNEKNDDKYYNEEISLDFIKNEFNPKLLIVEDNITSLSGSDISFKKDKNLYNQFYKFYKLNEEMKNKSINYDLVFKIRPDLYLHDTIDLENIKDDHIYLPIETKSDRKNNQLCDILAYGKPRIMNEYYNIYNHLENLIEKEDNNPEHLLYKYLNKLDIKYKKIDINYSVILSLCKTIAITGDSGSGKSTLSEFIKSSIKNSFILECDRYHKWERGNSNWKNITHLNPEANYIAKMEKDVFDLKIGKDIYQVDYDHSSGKFTDKKLIESDKNIIVCGLHASYNNHYNIKIFMDTEEELKIKWKIERDIEKRSYSKEKILKQISDRKKDYIKYILPQKNLSDIVVNYKIEKEKLILNLGVKKETKFQWYKFTEGDYNQIILNFIKNIY